MSGDLRIGGIRRGDSVEFTFEGERIVAQKGETIAMALWAHGQRVLRNSSRDGGPLAVLCNMGVCYECLVRTPHVHRHDANTCDNPRMIG